VLEVTINLGITKMGNKTKKSNAYY